MHTIQPTFWDNHSFQSSVHMLVWIFKVFWCLIIHGRLICIHSAQSENLSDLEIVLRILRIEHYSCPISRWCTRVTHSQDLPAQSWNSVNAQHSLGILRMRNTVSGFCEGATQSQDCANSQIAQNIYIVITNSYLSSSFLSMFPLLIQFQRGLRQVCQCT